MNYSLSKEVLDAIRASEAETYDIQIDGVVSQDEFDTLKFKKGEAERHLKNAQEMATTKSGELDKLMEELKTAKNSPGDVAKLTKEYEAKFEEHKAQSEAQIAKMREDADNAAITAAAGDIASKFKTPPLFKGLIADGLHVVEDSDSGKRVVRPKNIALSMSEFESSFLDNEDYSEYVVANVGSGGGATKSSGGGAPTKPWAEYTPKEKMQLEKTDPAKFAELSDQKLL